jgi:hypothetical protein
MGERFPAIIERIKKFDLNASDEDLKPIYDEIMAILPPAIKPKFETMTKFDQANEAEASWLKQFNLFEFYDFVLRRQVQMAERPDYFKWCNDCLWIVSDKDVMALVNIFMFNNEPPESISDIISFRYRKKLGMETLSLYKSMFWDTSAMNAKDAIYFYEPFRKNTMIIRTIRGGTEFEKADDPSNDGSDVAVTFHESDYIKWKIGYKKVTVPGPDAFLDKVMQDSYFKYYEAMNMLQSIEEETKDGNNDEFGHYDEIKKIKRNVEEQRAKAAKVWLDMFLRAKKYKSDGAAEDDMVKRIKALTIEFDEEKLTQIDEHDDIKDDIRKDM